VRLLTPRVHGVTLSPDEAQEFELATDAQFAAGTDTVEKRTYKVSFGQIYLSKPMMTEADGETETMFPHEARLRNLTCVAFFFWGLCAAVWLTRPLPAPHHTQTQVLRPAVRGCDQDGDCDPGGRV
jgi:hypothetical protein